MTRDDIIRMAREAGLTVGTNISGVMLVGSPSTPGIAHIDLDEMQRFAALVAAAEREAILAIAGSHGFNRMYGERSPSASDLVAVIRARGKHE